MKNYIRIVVTITAIFLLGILIMVFGLIKRIPFDRASGESVSALNYIAKMAEQEHSDLNRLAGVDFGVDYAVVDQEGKILYTNTPSDLKEEYLTVETAMCSRQLYRYLADSNGRVWGAVILLEDREGTFRQHINTVILCTVCALILIVTGMIIYGIYINKNIVMPFKRLKAFAGEIAMGNLDEPLQMDRSNLFGAFSESFDIMREELAESRKRELALQKKERELVASLSHDLKTPVTGIKVTAELMQMRLSVTCERKNVGEKDIRFTNEEISLLANDAEGIRGRAEQIDTLLSDLFTSAIDDLGEFKVSCADEESGILADLAKTFDDRGKVVIADIPAVIIKTDKKRMSQVIGNIISNSYKYADTRIDITAAISERYLEMKISDYGPGVPADEIDLIMNKFYRGKMWKDSDKDGHGMGLYIAKLLMNKMGGDLIAESEDKGLTVTLIIPLS